MLRRRRRRRSSRAARGSSTPHTVEIGGRAYHRAAHPGRHRRPAGACRRSRASSTRSPRTRRSTCTALPKRVVDRRRRLHRGRVRRHLPRGRRRGDADRSAATGPARLRRRRPRRISPTRCARRASRSARDDAGAIEVERGGDGLRRALDDGEALEADVVLYRDRPRAEHRRASASKRRACSSNKRGAVVVDEWPQTTVPSIFASATCTDRINLTPVAIAEGRARRRDAVQRQPDQDRPHERADRRVQPAAGRPVGLTEAGARALQARSTSTAPRSGR